MPDVPFTDSYATARETFCEAARDAGARLLPLPIEARGPAGEELTVDIAWLGSERAERWIVHSSGVHGVEGFAGSPIQAAILQQQICLPDQVGAILIHGVNPFGMAWLRRWNEDNIDLNRNCLRESGASLDVEPSRQERSPGYQGAPAIYSELDGLLNPTYVPGWFDTFYPSAVWQILRFGFSHLKQAIAEGQYEFPNGLFFGGHRLAESPRRIFQTIRSRLARAEIVVACDVHTGLGPYGVDALLVDEPADAPIVRELATHFGTRITPPEQGVAYAVRGAFLEMIRALGPAGAVYGITQEFGTYAAVTMLKTLRDENAFHHYGAPKNLAHPTKQWGLRAFVPDDPVWQAEIVRRGVEVYRQAADFLATK